MSAPTTQDQQTQIALHLQQVMLALTDQSADVARMIHQEAKAAFESAPPGATPVTDRAFAFDRAARAVRRAAMLAHKFGQPTQVTNATHHRTNARERIIRAVEDNIQRHARYDEADSLHDELLERLDGPDLEDAIATKPVPEIITELTRDLGLDIIKGADPRVRRTPADIAILWAHAAAPAPTAATHKPDRGRPRIVA